MLDQTKEERNAHQRDVSPFIQTRYYRSPEVILLAKDYGFSADIWSLGVLLSELMGNCQMYKKGSNGRFYFMGSSCYPISPADKQDTAKIAKDD